MAAAQVTDAMKTDLTAFLTNAPVVTIESTILWLVETLADIQSNTVVNQSNSQEITTYTYNGLTGVVTINLTFQSESWADNSGIVLKAASLIS